MRVTINGEAKDLPEGLCVATLLIHLGITAGRVAIELNLQILPREQWETKQVQPGDKFEIVHFVGGG